MNHGRGAFIAVEGTDGSGKGTQFKLLVERLEAHGYEVETFDFPQYEQPSSYFVREYLNGNYGSIGEVGPYTASLFYALDRFEAAPRIRKAIEDGKIVLANRYVGSSMAHQGTKFQHAEERRGYFIWLDNLEFEMLRIPRPDFSFVLRVPPETSQKLLHDRAAAGGKELDMHELDLSHLQRATEVYEDMCQLFPRDFVRIDCARDGELIDIKTIHEILWQKLGAVLPAKPGKKSTDSKPVKQDNSIELPTVVEAKIDHSNDPTISTTETETISGKQMIPAGEVTQALDDLVTSMENDVFALTHGLSSARAAHVIAQLSQRGDDLRTGILAEFQDVPDEALGSSASTAHLLANHLVIQNASILLSKKLERGRLASYVERASRLMTYDLKDKNDNYRYHTPAHFDEKLKQQYRAYMDQIFNLYSEMVQILTKHLQGVSKTPPNIDEKTWESALRQESRDILRSVLPVAATTDVAIYGSGFALENIITGLSSDALVEARMCGGAILTESRKLIPGFMPDEQLSEMTLYKANSHQRLDELSKKYLPAFYADETNPVQLVQVWPRNEMDLLADMLYPQSNLPLKVIHEAIDTWRYDRKIEVFEAYIGDRQNLAQRPGRALEKAHYSWDLLSDFDTFRDLQRHRVVDDLDWQELTPRYGYDIPTVVEDAELTDQFEACFELSLRLHSLIQEAGYHADAQYATLLGHRLRWTVTYNAREAFHLHELRTSPHNRKAVRKLVQAMHEKVAQVHPMLAEAMKFYSDADS